MTLTRVQECIVNYLKTQFHEGVVTMTPKGDSSIILIDRTGAEMIFSANIYCDILDGDTGQLIATSDVPHTLDAVGTVLPKSWTNNPAYFG